MLYKFQQNIILSIQNLILLFSSIFINLIKNAIEAGLTTPIIKVYVETSDPFVKITVADDGKGMSTDLLNQLGHQEVTYGKIDGHGIGLYKASKIVNSWSGNLNIKSQLGVGTSVSISLPIIEPPTSFISEINFQLIKTVLS